MPDETVGGEGAAGNDGGCLVARPVYPVPSRRPVNQGLIGEIQKGQKLPGVSVTTAATDAERTVETTLTASDYERVEKIAKRHGLTVSEYLRRALADEVRYDDVTEEGGEVIIKERSGRLERVRYGR